MRTRTTWEDIWDFIIGAFPTTFGILMLICVIWAIGFLATRFTQPTWYVQPKGGGSALYFPKDTYSCNSVNEPDYILVTCKELETNKISIIQASVFQER